MDQQVFTYKGPGWVKEANKLGKYSKTYYGFRIYTVKPADTKVTFENREDGVWRRTDFLPGEYIAIDKYGVRYEGKYWDVIAKIDIDVLQQRFCKK